MTGDDGRFSFDALPAGALTLAVPQPHDQPRRHARSRVTLGKRLSLTIHVDSQERYASVVRGRRAQVETVEQTLQAEEIKHIPGTQGDTLKAVQNLPGVARAPYGIGLLPVWGSSPADTRVYVDGVDIPTLYHFGGLRSTVNSEMVDALTFVPGGYQARPRPGPGRHHRRRRPARPRTDGFHGYAQFDLLDGSAMLEGPLTKKLSFAAAARRSWVDTDAAVLHQQLAAALARLLGLPGAALVPPDDARHRRRVPPRVGRPPERARAELRDERHARPPRTSTFIAASSAGRGGWKAAARSR